MVELTSPPNMHDDSPVSLTRDQREVTLAMARKIAEAAGYLHKLTKDDRLTVAMRSATVGLIGHHLRDLGKAVGHDADVATEREHDSKTIRALNEEIARLRRQIGEATPTAGLAERLALIGKEVDAWWEGLGFCLSEVNVRVSSHRAWVVAEFKAMIRDWESRHSETPVSDRERIRTKLDEMADSGLEIHREDERHASVVDSPASREWIMARLRGRFPSVRLYKWESITLGDRSRPFDSQIRSVHVTFDFADLLRAATTEDIVDDRD